MKKTIITTIFAAIIPGTANVFAQDEILREVNAIKSQNDLYFWGQFAHPDADSARVKAIGSLLADINYGRDESQLLTYSDVSRFVKYIPIPRATLTRGFAYMKKSDIENINGNGSQNGNEDQNMNGNRDMNGNGNEGADVRSIITGPFVPDMFVQGILQRKKFQDVYRYLRALKADGQVQLFGSLHEVEDYSSLSLIIFDRESQEIVTVLSPVNQDGSRTNLTTGMTDSLDNYPKQMSAVIYYIRKQ